MFTALQQNQDDEDNEESVGNDGDDAMTDSIPTTKSTSNAFSMQSTNITSNGVGDDPAMADEDDEIT